MRTSFCAAAGVLVAGFPTAVASQSAPVTAQQQISLFHPEDFAFSLGGPEPSNLVDNFQLRGVNVNQLPALDDQGISMALVNLGPCAINLPHVHPRATEMLYTIEGRELRVAFVEENGGEGAVVNDLVAGDVAFFPQGLIHYQQNLDCYPATFLAALNSEDPGVVTITTRFFELPSEAIQASLNLDDPTLKALIASLPQAPALAQRECLQRCGLLDDDDTFSFDFDSDSGDYDSGGSDFDFFGSH
eukprot:jgi/Undpi1/2869/HiC_scaffold_14.g06246.m1